MRADLGLQAGDALLLQPLLGSAQKRYRSRLIGFLPSHSLIVSPPEDHGGVIAIQDGDGFAVRTFVGDRALAFTGSVLRVCTHPYRYLHLTYPQRIQEVVVRKSKRVRVGCEARLTAASAAGKPATILLIDLSATGTMLEGAPGLAQPGEAVSLEASLPFADMPDQAVTLAGIVKTVTPAPQGESLCHYGLEFTDLLAMTLITLRAFVYEQLDTGNHAR